LYVGFMSKTAKINIWPTFFPVLPTALASTHAKVEALDPPLFPA